MKEAILYIGRFNLPNGSAAAQRVKTNAEIFKELGYETKFLSTWQQDSLFKEYMGCNLNAIKEYQQIFKINFIEEYIKRNSLEYNFKFIILYNYHSIASLRIIKLAKKYNIKIIGDVTEWYGTVTNHKKILQFYKNLDTAIRMKCILPKLDGLFVISKLLQNYYKDKTKTLYLPNLYNPNDEKWSILNVDKELSKDKLIFTYAGNPGELFEKEDIATIIRVFSSLKRTDITLRIIGISYDEFLHRYKNLYNDVPIIKNCEFYGKLKHDITLKMIYNSHFFIYLRPDTLANRAGFPTKFLEANVLKTPVITNEIGDIHLYLIENENGYLTNNNYSNLTEIINKLKLEDSLSTKHKELFVINDYEILINKFLDQL